MVAAGAEHTAAVTEDGKVYGWGWGRYGNLGLGDRNDRLVPEQATSIGVSPKACVCSGHTKPRVFRFPICNNLAEVSAGKLLPDEVVGFKNASGDTVQESQSGDVRHSHRDVEARVAGAVI